MSLGDAPAGGAEVGTAAHDALLTDLIASSESHMHRSIAVLQQTTLRNLHEDLQVECRRVFFRCMEVGLSPQEAQDAANQLRMQQYVLATVGMRQQIAALHTEHWYRVEALRRWYAQHVATRVDAHNEERAT